MFASQMITVNPLAIGKHYNPIKEDAWDVGEFDRDSVLNADDEFIATHCGDLPHMEASENLKETQEYHIARVAYLVKNHEESDVEGSQESHPITLGFSQINGRSENAVSVWDGNHRLSAAIIRKDETIRARVQYNSESTFEFFSYIQDVIGVRI